MKKFRQLEAIVKGFSNHRRIEILTLLEKTPNLSLSEISEVLGVNFKTVAEHTRRLTIAGLVMKWNVGAAVHHAVAPVGRVVLKFLRTLE